MRLSTAAAFSSIIRPRTRFLTWRPCTSANWLGCTERVPLGSVGTDRVPLAAAITRLHTMKTAQRLHSNSTGIIIRLRTPAQLRMQSDFRCADACGDCRCSFNDYADDYDNAHVTIVLLSQNCSAIHQTRHTVFFFSAKLLRGHNVWNCIQLFKRFAFGLFCFACARILHTVPHIG